MNAMTKLNELVRCIKGNHVYIQMHNYPDQDALASAVGLQALLRYKGIDSIIAYHGIIDKDNTLKMIELLHITLYPVEDLDILTEDEIVIVDAQKGNINVRELRGNEIACIDHHKQQNTDCYRFYDIRSNVGACSSIIASYFFENDIPLSEDVATALVYGQQMDTAHMSRGVSDLDIDMFSPLYKAANLVKLRKFETSSLKRGDLMNYQEAIKNLKICRNIGIADIGKNCPEGIIASVSDFFLTLSELEFVMVYSFRAGGLKFSVRSSNESLDASEIIRQALYGLGDGGGHSDMAAGFIPNITSEKEAESIAQHVEERLILLVQFTSLPSPSYDSSVC
ncbi:MAG: DHH family phosphoesterase [Lachnospiraceae bacterium]|nr:DHH family phosphoesterase [Lachnospiraceae bacterium]